MRFCRDEEREDEGNTRGGFPLPFCARFVLAERKVLLVSREKDIIDVASRAHSNRH